MVLLDSLCTHAAANTVYFVLTCSIAMRIKKKWEKPWRLRTLKQERQRENNNRDAEEEEEEVGDEWRPTGALS